MARFFCVNQKAICGFLQQFIKDFQCIIKRNGLSYDDISKDILREVKKIIIGLIKTKNVANDFIFENCIYFFF